MKVFTDKKKRRGNPWI